MNIKSLQGGKTFLCFGDAEYLSLLNTWKEKEKNIDCKEIKLARECAAMLRHKVRTDEKLKMFDKNKYPSPTDIFKNIDELISDTLNFFMNEFLLKDTKGDLSKVKNKCSVYKHGVTSILRPQSFLSPLQLGISIYLHKKFGSKNLCKAASNFGVSVSYEEALLYEKSIVLAPRLKIKKKRFFPMDV